MLAWLAQYVQLIVTSIIIVVVTAIPCGIIVYVGNREVGLFVKFLEGAGRAPNKCQTRADEGDEIAR